MIVVEGLAVGWRNIPITLTDPRPSTSHETILPMPKKRKINLERVRASLNTLCAKCGYSMPPQEIRRVTFYEVECPKCGERFVPGSGAWKI